MGLVLFNKKSGITSFEALGDIKRFLGTQKVGHTGTLDKFAQGLLLVLTGRDLKLSKWFSACDKQYIGRIKFGQETDTLDPEGNITAEATVPKYEQVEQIIGRFTGGIMQAPPAFSAIHIDGKRAHELARSGKMPEMKKRAVFIYKLELLSWEPPFAEIFVHCSSGVYIRSLARDIALAAGSRAHLAALTRTQIAGFILGTWECTAENREKLIYSASPTSKNPYSLLPINKAVITALGLPWLEITFDETKHIIHGKPLAPIMEGKTLSSPDVEGDFSAAVFCEDTLIAIIEKSGCEWKYGCVFTENS